MTPPPDPGTNGPGEAASELGMPPSSSPPHPSKKAAAPPKKVKFSGTPRCSVWSVAMR